MRGKAQYFTNVVFWLLVFTIQFLLSSQFVSYTKAAYFAAGNVFFQASLFYIISRILFPKYFNKGYTKTFVLVNIATLLIFTLAQTSAEIWASQFADHTLNKPRHHEFFIAFRAFNWLILVDFVATTFGLYRNMKEREINQKQLREDKLDTEIKLLKAQINPHFVFNALNNIYSMTYMKSDQAPESVLKLSQMLRYVFNDCSHDQVPINSEVEYINNFIDFQRMKSPHQQNIKFCKSVENPQATVAPMLMIPFLENSFKYSRIEEDKNASVTISLRVENQVLSFEVSNTFANHNRPKHGNGMGIKNVQNRLDLIYAGKHKLNIEEDEKIFAVNLTIDLS